MVLHCVAGTDCVVLRINPDVASVNVAMIVLVKIRKVRLG